jgi:hypothetical protein
MIQPRRSTRSTTCAVVAAMAIATIGAIGLSAPASAIVPTIPTLSIVAGTGTAGAPTPGTATSSELDNPFGTTLDSSGNLYIADSFNHEVEKVTPGGTLSVIAGDGSSGTPTPGPATSSALNLPSGVAVDSSGNVYVADAANAEILKVTPGGTLSIFAGTGVAGPPTPGPATSSELQGPFGVAMGPSGNVYIGDTNNHEVEKVTPSGTLSVVVSSLSNPTGIAFDAAGNMYVADSGDNQIIKVTPSGTSSVFAGTGTFGASTPGPATSSDLAIARGVSVDSAGNVYIGDTFNNEVDVVSPTGSLSVLAGTGTAGAPTAGPAASSQLDEPWAVVADASGNLYVADAANNLIEKISDIYPSSPTNVRAALVGGQISASWTAPAAGATPVGYTVTPFINGVAATPVTVTGTMYVVTNPEPGASYQFMVSANGSVAAGPPSGLSNSVSVPVLSAGYWTVGADGGVFSFGSPFDGSTGNLKLNQPVVAIASTPDGKGYWLAAKDGGVFSFGGAVFHGSVPGLGDHVTNIVGMATDSTTGGYWLVGSDGTVYAFDAPNDGSIPGLGQHLSNVVGIAATADGGGYYLVTSTGAVYAFGDGTYQGGANTLPHLNAPIVGLSVDSATGGYWEVGSDGGIFSYGAPFHGSAGAISLNKPVVGMSATADGSGYYLVASDGGVFSYDAPFLGSMGGQKLNAPMVGIATAGSPNP